MRQFHALREWAPVDGWCRSHRDRSRIGSREKKNARARGCWQLSLKRPLRVGRLRANALVGVAGRLLQFA